MAFSYLLLFLLGLLRLLYLQLEVDVVELLCVLLLPNLDSLLRTDVVSVILLVNLVLGSVLGVVAARHLYKEPSL